MKQIHVRFVPGDEAVLNGEIRGRVLRIQANFPYRVLYEFCWWKEGDRREAWVEDFELSELIEQNEAAHSKVEEG